MQHKFKPLDSPGERPGKECPRCHTTFFCAVGKDCWCETLYLDGETLKKLRTDYIDCLCPACLKQFEDHKN